MTHVDSPNAAPAAAVPLERARFIRHQLPAGGLFANQNWRISPEPFRLDADTAVELSTLGRILLQFYRAANLLYRQSVAGKQPAWVAHWLDLGKPAPLIELQRAAVFKNAVPRVIRPDLLLTDQGPKLTELDSVPGGIGLTSWLNHVYTELGMEVIGGREGMERGFLSIFGDASTIHLVVSEESSTYRPEMAWLAQRLNALGACCVARSAAPFVPASGDAVYRFFELFDLANVPAAEAVFQAALRREIHLTPPPKAYLEEKLLLGLLWNRHLRDFWRQELGSAFFDRLLQLVPYTWVVDPTPLPPHASVPQLGLTDWRQLKSLSQRERDLILKVSGYSAEAWGARGVYLGSDLSAADWAAAVDRALASFSSGPYVLQSFEKPRRVPMTWANLAEARVVVDEGRARLCPFYFVSGEGDGLRTALGGVLATLCPVDKKIIHGMEEAVLAPCAL